MPPVPSQQATNICQLCNSQGHYDYQCQFAGNFMARTQKAFNQGRSYSHQDPNHGDWSHGCCDMGQNDTIGKIELNPSFVLSSDNTNYKNDIQ